MSERYHPIGECVNVYFFYCKLFTYKECMERDQFEISTNQLCPTLGEYFKNVKYKDVYKWFNCMQVYIVHCSICHQLVKLSNSN